MPEIDKGSKFVPMRHKETGGVTTTTIAAFEEVHSQNGWERVTHENTDGATLLEIAEEQGIIVPADTDDKVILSDTMNPDLASGSDATVPDGTLDDTEEEDED